MAVRWEEDQGEGIGGKNESAFPGSVHRSIAAGVVDAERSDRWAGVCCCWQVCSVYAAPNISARRRGFSTGPRFPAADRRPREQRRAPEAHLHDEPGPSGWRKGDSLAALDPAEK